MKTAYFSRTYRVKPVRPNAVSLANADRVKRLLARTARRSSSVEDTSVKAPRVIFLF